MNIKILSRTKAVKLSYTDFANDKVIISIKDPWAENAHFNRNNSSIKEILYLSFYDISEETKDIFGGYESMTPKDALLIAAIVNKWKGMVDTIWVHCEVGVSRSAGIAMAIMEYLNTDLTLIFENSTYRPNMLCYELTKNAFENEECLIIKLAEFSKGRSFTSEEVTHYRTVRFNHIREDEKRLKIALELVDKVAQRYGVNAEDVRKNKCSSSNDNEHKIVSARRISMYIMHEVLKIPVFQIMQIFNMDNAVVFYSIGEIKLKMKEDETLNRIITEIQNEVKE